MTSVIKFTPLSGAKDKEPLCYLLEVDDFTFLLDCGWDEGFTQDFVTTIMLHIPRIDAVLVTHSDMEHLGALPALVRPLGLTAPIYVTLPVYEMGQMFLYDVYQSHYGAEEFQTFTLDDVDEVFRNMHQLKYSQVFTIPGRPDNDISIIPMAAGHMLGGTIWKIIKDQEEIIYAVDYNHKTERHLAGCALPKIVRPSLLITDTYNMDVWIQEPRKKREKELIETITETLRGDGNVLMPTDTAGRVLELLLFLDEVWTQRNLKVYPLVWLCQMAHNVLDFARSTLEWMNDSMMRVFQTSRGNPFDFKNVRVVTSMSALRALPPGPKLVLTTLPSLSSGFSRALFVEWAEDPRNTVLFTTRLRPNTLAGQLMAKDRQKVFEFDFKQRVPLEGAELEAFLKKRRDAREKEEQKRREEEARMKMQMLVWSQDESDESDVEETIDPRNTAHRHDIPMEIDQAQLAHLKNAPRYPMFPSIETRLKGDDYGVIVKPEDFLLPGEENEPVAAKMDLDDEAAQRRREQEAEDLALANKCVVRRVKLDVQCRVRYVDFEGRSDGASMSTILSQVAARQMVLVHGSETAMNVLLDQIKEKPKEFGRALVPELKECINATSDINIFQVKLKDSLVYGVDFKKVMHNDTEYELGWFDGQIHFRSEEHDLPVLDTMPRDKIKPHRPVYVGEVVLPTMRKALAAKGIRAEFVGGVLICDDIIAVKKGPEGQVTLEGPLCESYFKVRSILYGQYAVI